ncbi:MAG: N-acetylglucosamine-specific PTS transporter subunit IIBC [Acholeplasma sp.]|nr:N-acetylglucosamine-specific PTS transporter subunit IIBC [Acholeplasma sp.]
MEGTGSKFRDVLAQVFGYLQKLGRALMLPVAVLPAAAILLGVGYWIDPDGWGSGSIVSNFLVKSGAAIIDNLAIIFAVGVSYGLSKDKDGASALSGLVAFLLFTTVLSTGSATNFLGTLTDKEKVAFDKINNPFIGILSGIIGGHVYNKFSKVELPKALAFFSGRRLGPIMTSFITMVITIPMLFIWPVFFGGLVSFGDWMVGLGSFGAGLFGLFNRLLIPFGLHHALNNVFWFGTIGINDIGNFFGDAAIDHGYTVGMYQAGFFPIMMGGLIGAALAMIHTAKPENKDNVKSIMIAAAFASFLTGVTEPIEFAFLFVAPLLFVVHAVLTGVSMFIAASIPAISGFAFSAGFIDLVLSAKNPHATNWWILPILAVAFGAIYYFVFRFLIVKLNIKTPGREDVLDGVTVLTGSASHAAKAEAFLAALGGKENLTSIDHCVTRLRLQVKNPELINRDAIKAAGASGVLVAKNNVQIVVGTTVQFVADELKKIA